MNVVAWMQAIQFCLESKDWHGTIIKRPQQYPHRFCLESKDWHGTIKNITIESQCMFCLESKDWHGTIVIRGESIERGFALNPKTGMVQ